MQENRNNSKRHCWDSPIQSQGPYKLTYIWQLQCSLVTLWGGILPQHSTVSGCKELWHVDTCCPSFTFKSSFSDTQSLQRAKVAIERISQHTIHNQHILVGITEIIKAGPHILAADSHAPAFKMKHDSPATQDPKGRCFIRQSFRLYWGVIWSASRALRSSSGSSCEMQG